MLQFFQNVGQILSRLGELISQLVGGLAQVILVLLGVMGIIAMLAAVILVYIVLGALLEYWLRWAWRRKHQLWPPLVTLFVWPVVTAISVAIIGAIPLTFHWFGLDVDWAILFGAVGVIVSIVVNVFTNPLERPRNWFIAEYRRVRPLYKRYRSTEDALNLWNGSERKASHLVLNQGDEVELADRNQTAGELHKMHHRTLGVVWVRIQYLEVI